MIPKQAADRQDVWRYEAAFTRLDAWLGRISTLLAFGRQGLFADDDMHHALTMGYRAADCVGGNGRFDWERWRAFRQEFEKYIVED